MLKSFEVLTSISDANNNINKLNQKHIEKRNIFYKNLNDVEDYKRHQIRN